MGEFKFVTRVIKAWKLVLRNIHITLSSIFKFQSEDFERVKI